MKLSIVIPTYKNKRLFFDNLIHNLQFFDGNEIIIVNDDPEEEIKNELTMYLREKKFKNLQNITIFDNKKNLGFGGAVNLGIRKTSNELVMILNSDVRLISNSYLKVFSYFKKNKNLLAVAFAQKENDGSIVGKNTIYWQRGMFFHKKNDNLVYGRTAWFEGGAAVINKEKFLELAGYDNLYTPFYWEDIDLSYRGYKRGYEIIFDPSIIVEHHHQSTIGKYFTKNFTEVIAFRNQLIFIWKNISDWKLLFSHFVFLPYYGIFFIYKRKFGFILGLIKALAKLGEILKKRKEIKTLKKVKDREILNLFKYKE